MTNEIQIFDNVEFGKVRGTFIDNEPWLVGKDIAIALGYSNPRDALSKHVDDDDKGVAKCDTLGGSQQVTIINESGFYSLVFSSKLPTAKKFKHWVTSEVLPSIRKTGSYSFKRDEESLHEISAEKAKRVLDIATDTIMKMDKMFHLNGVAKLTMFKELVEPYGIKVPNTIVSNNLHPAEELLDYFNIHISPESFFDMLYKKGWATKANKIYPISQEVSMYQCKLIGDGVKYGVNYWFNEGQCFVAMFRDINFQSLCLDLAMDVKLKMEVQ